MDFSSGNSGNQLTEAVIKIGPGCQQEGAFCQYLGEEVTPRVYAIIQNGYVMERLAKHFPSKLLLKKIEYVLSTRVWSRPATPWSMDVDWRDCLLEYGVKVPDWAVPTEFCLVHGDPTVSNCLIRMVDRNGVATPELVIADPRPPRNYIPQCRETDMGRIVQSFLGWEQAAYGYEFVRYEFPDFFKDKDTHRRARFWCGATAARIEYLERSRGNRKNILDWCQSVREKCEISLS